MWKRNKPIVSPQKVPERLVPLGEIVATHGIEGWLRLKPYNPQSTTLFSTEEIFLEKDGTLSSYSLLQIRPHKSFFLLKLLRIDGINEAKKRVGAVLSVLEEALHPLAPGEYYDYQVMGFDVFDTQNRRIGTITRIWSMAGGTLFVVGGEEKEYLIPAVKEMIEKIDIPAKKMVINPPPGLLDL